MGVFSEHSVYHDDAKYSAHAVESQWSRANCCL